jgi:hypothetical protein
MIADSIGATWRPLLTISLILASELGQQEKRCMRVKWFFPVTAHRFNCHPRVYENQPDTQEYSGRVEHGAPISNASSHIRGSSWNPLPFALARLRVACLMWITCAFIVRMSISPALSELTDLPLKQKHLHGFSELQFSWEHKLLLLLFGSEQMS